MKENKLTPEEIKKALECCENTEDGCLHCPLYGLPAPECGVRLCRESLELHKSQQTEIEQWKEEANRYQTLWCEDVQIARAEAIKEFAEKLKEKPWMYYVVDIDNLVKEMVGDDK